ncbi:MAG: PD40 domain-containing protein [Acidobacteria bacterium]|nr:PD40 domain-containing protein [Acidobacteriota bacterium]
MSSPSNTVRWFTVLACVLTTWAFTQPASAQYFGQNKVQYERFDFKVLKTEHFDIHHYPAEQQAVEHAARLAERWHQRLSALLQHELTGRQPLVLYAGHPHFEQTNVIEGFIGESTGGVTESLKRRIVMPFASSLGQTDHVLGHELVHAFQYDILGKDNPRAAQLPLWFIEGMAEYLSLGPVDPHTAMWMRSAVMQEKLPDIDDLNNPKYFPYRWGHAVWAYIGGRFGDAVIGDILQAGSDGDPIGAIERIVGVEIDELSKDWHAALRSTYGDITKTKPDAPPAARSVLTKKTAGRLNVSPSLSPDGSRMLFFSERDLFSIDLFLADARTGRIIRKIIDTATDPHLDSLQFIASAGAWDRTGQRLAVASTKEGKPSLLILNAADGRTEREIKLPQLTEIFNPAFSPDGRSVALSASAGGLSDLYLYHLDSNELKPLTTDAYADLQPAWSPDGRTIAFVTDRFTTTIETLAFGPYRLALMDVRSGSVRELPGIADAKSINPQWSRDGRRLFFVADRQGISNVYAIEVAGGRVLQITDVATGVSGITDLSPALSSASNADTLAFSLYREDNYEIYRIEGAALQGAAASGSDARRVAGMLPPVDRRQSAVSVALADPQTGLPPRDTATVQDYKPRLELVMAGQPQIIAGADRFGSFIGGGLSLLFSDTLGNHMLGTVFQVQGSARDFAGQAVYLNRERRLNWGTVGEWVPYVTGGFQQFVTTSGGQPILVEQTLIDRQIHRAVSGIVAYPFNRAQRVEFMAGARSIDFQRELVTQAFARTGELLVDERKSLPAGRTLNFGEASAALVFDTALTGPTSPLRGQRYRLEVAPTIGDLTMSSVVADYRHYVMPVRPLTLAGRILHVGRYGRDASDLRLNPLFLGYPTLVRGYDFGSFSASECVPAANSQCPAFDRLLGTRLLVTNLELRFPLVGIFKGELNYGPLPLEGLLFADGGIAWARSDQPAFFSGERKFVRSVGAGFRVNALGFAVLELNAVRALDRPRQNWMFVFNFRPGF